ncbi:MULTISPECIES: hypothetical protein [Rhizobium]|uniref:Uncharacterized protein n=1 Tax=Rhizobium straminoryzae TaxID=1387186 RepID=A0A549T858_9HYPH|nr:MULTISPECIES: hypothetical protein [Rhizobium]TRL38053.1 hypothetical protein FNA46_13695 [Rhizobium straminoryzae]
MYGRRKGGGEIDPAPVSWLILVQVPENNGSDPAGQLQALAQGELSRSDDQGLFAPIDPTCRLV